MKQTLTRSFQVFILLIASMLVSVIGFAQDKKLEVDINTKSEDSNILSQPWVWVVGAAVFILILVALIRGKK